MIRQSFGNDPEGRLANAQQEVDRLLEIMRTGAYDEVMTPQTVSHELWNWSTQVVFLKKMVGIDSGQMELLLDPFVPQKPTRKVKTVVYETPLSKTAVDLMSSDWGISRE